MQMDACVKTSVTILCAARRGQWNHCGLMSAPTVDHVTLEMGASG